MAKRDIPNDVLKPLTIAVVVVMFAAVAGIQLINRIGGIEEQDDTYLQEVDLEQLISDFVPPPDVFDDLFTATLQTEEMKSTPITFFGRDGELLDAVVSKPEGEGPFPVVVLVHGEQSSTRLTEELSETVGEQLMQNLGVLAVAIDWRESDFGEEDLTDTLSTLDWIAEVQEAAGQPVVLFGTDHGAYLALRAATEVAVEGIVAAYGYVDIPAQYAALQEQGEDRAQQFLRQTGCDGVVDSEACLAQLSVVDDIQDQNIFVLHNAQDPLVPLSQAEAILNTQGHGERAQVRLDNGDLPHHLLGAENEEVNNALIQIELWIQGQLGLLTPTL